MGMFELHMKWKQKYEKEKEKQENKSAAHVAISSPISTNNMRISIRIGFFGTRCMHLHPISPTEFEFWWHGVFADVSHICKHEY